MTTPTMPIRSGLFFSAIVLALASIQATAAPLSLQCPASYPAERQLLDLRAKGWHAPAMSEQGLPLTEAGLLTGPPEDNGELRGGDLPNDTGRRFNFAGTSDDGEKWVYCDYGNGNGLRRGCKRTARYGNYRKDSGPRAVASPARRKRITRRSTTPTRRAGATSTDVAT